MHGYLYIHGHIHTYTHKIFVLWIINYENCQEIWKYIEIIIII